MLTYKREAHGLLVTTTAKNGNVSAITIGYETALQAKDAGHALSAYSKGAPSFRRAALTLMDVAQQAGKLNPFFGSKMVSQDLLKKMKECEEIAGRDFGLTMDDWKELRQPGQYADTRSAMLKAWSFGEALRVGVDANGAPVLLTMNGLRKINATHRKTPEAKTLDDYLESLSQYLTDHPDQAVQAESRLHKIMSDARALLDANKREELHAETIDSDDNPETGKAEPGPVVAVMAEQTIPTAPVAEGSDDDIDETDDENAAEKLAETA